MAVDEYKEFVRANSEAVGEMAKAAAEIRAVLDKHRVLSPELRCGALEMTLAAERALWADIEAKLSGADEDTVERAMPKEAEGKKE